MISPEKNKTFVTLAEQVVVNNKIIEQVTEVNLFVNQASNQGDLEDEVRQVNHIAKQTANNLKQNRVYIMDRYERREEI